VWPTAPLQSLCEFVRDGDWIETKDQGGSDFRLLQISNIGVGHFVETGNFRWITAETFERLNCTEIKKQDVLIARMPEPTGRAWCVQSLPWRAITAVDVAIVRTLRDRLLPSFLAHYLNSPRALAHTESLTTGTTRRRIRRADIEQFKVPVPPLDEQWRIAGVLGALDEKIEHNRRRGERLAALARLEFERWFQSLSSAPRVDVAELIASGALVVNDGYRAKNSEMAPEGVPFLRGGNVNDDVNLGGADLLGLDGVRRAKDKVARVGDAFFTAKGTVGRIGRVSRWTPKFVYSPQISFWRSLDEHLLSPEYLYLWLGSGHFIEQRDAVKGQTDMADYVNLRDQRAMTIVLAPPAFQRELESLVRPLLDSEALARAESRRLAVILDTLLPKLVSGKIRVPEHYDPADVLATVVGQATAG
jgi:type I restriction enzyme S subunit